MMDKRRRLALFPLVRLWSGPLDWPRLMIVIISLESFRRRRQRRQRRPITCARAAAAAA